MVPKLKSYQIYLKICTLFPTHYLYSSLKRRGRGNDCFHVASTWNTRGVFVGLNSKA